MPPNPVPSLPPRYTETSIPFAYIYRSSSGELTRVELLGLNGAEPPAGWESLEHVKVLLPATDVAPEYRWHEHDWKIFKDLKFTFVEKLIAAGLQYRMCGQVSQALNELITRNTPNQT